MFYVVGVSMGVKSDLFFLRKECISKTFGNMVLRRIF
jgi:hypothetical protein